MEEITREIQNCIKLATNVILDVQICAMVMVSSSIQDSKRQRSQLLSSITSLIAILSKHQMCRLFSHFRNISENVFNLLQIQSFSGSGPITTEDSLTYNISNKNKKTQTSVNGRKEIFPKLYGNIMVLFRYENQIGVGEKQKHLRKNPSLPRATIVCNSVPFVIP